MVLEKTEEKAEVKAEVKATAATAIVAEKALVSSFYLHGVTCENRKRCVLAAGSLCPATALRHRILTT